MKRVWHTPATILTGLFVTALCAMSQDGTISARPGAINYIEGAASVNGAAIQGKSTRGKTFLGANDTLATEQGKAEVLLTPGVFLRLDANSEIKMVSPSLTATQVEVSRGSALVEVDQLLKENDIQIIDHGKSVELVKTGLYRFSASSPAVEQTLDGKAEIAEDGHHVSIGKNHQIELDNPVKAEKIHDNPEHSDLYAWSKVRDEYVAAASFSSAKTVVDVPGGGWGWGSGFGWGFGPSAFYGGGFGPGWAWNPYWNTYAWLPGSGAFYSPFGYGFYAPTVVAYAPYVVKPVNGHPVTVPINPSRPAIGGTAALPVHNTGATVTRSGAVIPRSGFSGGAAPRSSGGAPSGGGAHAMGGFSGGHMGGGGGHR